MTHHKYRVLQLASTSDLGGAERMVLWLLEGIDAERFTMFAGALIGGGDLVNRARENGFEAMHFGFRSAWDPAGIRRLIRFIRDNQIDIVQTHGLRADAVARWAARMGGARAVISTIHSIDPWRRLPHVLLDRMTAPFVTRYVAVCEAAKSASVLREKIPAEKVDVVYIGLPPRDIPRQERDAIRMQLGIPADAFPVIGILANFREMKGHSHAIAAMPGILQHLPQAALLLAGKEDAEQKIRRLVSDMNLNQHVYLPGFVQDTARLLAAIDIFLLPSDWEGLPVSILEAMHAGVPVIASNVGGIPELIRHEQDGLLIQPRSPEQITAAVIRLSKDWALRASVSKAADARAQSEFSLSRMASRMETIYENVLGTANTGQPT